MSYSDLLKIPHSYEHDCINDFDSATTAAARKGNHHYNDALNDALGKGGHVESYNSSSSGYKPNVMPERAPGEGVTYSTDHWKPKAHKERETHSHGDMVGDKAWEDTCRSKHALGDAIMQAGNAMANPLMGAYGAARNAIGYAEGGETRQEYASGGQPRQEYGIGGDIAHFLAPYAGGVGTVAGGLLGGPAGAALGGLGGTMLGDLANRWADSSDRSEAQEKQRNQQASYGMQNQMPVNYNNMQNMGRQRSMQAYNMPQYDQGYYNMQEEMPMDYRGMNQYQQPQRNMGSYNMDRSYGGYGRQGYYAEGGDIHPQKHEMGDEVYSPRVNRAYASSTQPATMKHGGHAMKGCKNKKSY